MCLDLLADSRFLSLLLDFDRDLAAQTRAHRCLDCGGPLHVANYRRKPRGARCELPEDFSVRLSFCCGRDGCRHRDTPPSLRFLGPKVYLSVTITLITTLRHGPTPPRLAALRAEIGVSPVTVARWRSWWLKAFSSSPFWRSLRARFAPDLDVGSLPGSLIAALPGALAEQLRALLELLLPITTRPGLSGLAR